MARCRVLVLTYHKTQWDSRIVRMIGTLAHAGHEVTLLSPDAQPAIPGLEAHRKVPTVNASRGDFLRNVALMAPASALAAAALPLHRRQPSYRKAVDHILALRPDIIHANDWVTLPAAVDAAASSGSRVIYDSHEVASQEHADRLWWRMAARQHVSAIEGRLIGKTDHVITISDGIGQFLTAHYGKAIKALSVVRNLPVLTDVQKISCDEKRIGLAYIGLIRPERQLDVMIRALSMLDERYHLAITGFGPESYLRKLKQYALSLGVSDRMTWDPPVPPEAVVQHLSQSDIGLYLSHGHSAQQRLALPNKIFEYTAAGLALISAGSVDVEALFMEHGHGLALTDTKVETLVAAIRSLDVSDANGDSALALMKKHALRAAQILNWQQEQHKLLAVYERLASLASISKY